jgi:hypothetical protein
VRGVSNCFEELSYEYAIPLELQLQGAINPVRRLSQIAEPGRPHSSGNSCHLEVEGQTNRMPAYLQSAGGATEYGRGGLTRPQTLGMVRPLRPEFKKSIPVKAAGRKKRPRASQGKKSSPVKAGESIRYRIR